MCDHLLLTIYRLHLTRASARVGFIEKSLGFDEEAPPLSEDDRRNEPGVHVALFSEDCRSYVAKLFLGALKELTALPYDRSADVLNGLAFLQEIIATALWKHGCSVGARLESFAREFDRLDRPDERLRLYRHAQSISESGRADEE